MKKVLIVYSEMVIGGSTTSLLSLLNLFDYEKYEIDLLLYSNDGEMQDRIDKRVNVLQEMRTSRRVWKKLVRPDYYVSCMIAKFIARKKNNRLINSQFLSRYEAVSCKRLEEEYDIAISFLEFLPMEYLAHRVNAKRKIAWIHIDIKEGGLLPRISRGVYRKIDRIVVVSKSCADSFCYLYPEFKNKCVYLPNLLSAGVIREMAAGQSEISYTTSTLNLVTVARIVFASKGFDRAVRVFKRLKQDGNLPLNVRWFIIGDGPDFAELSRLINDNGLDEQIILLGKHSNPFSIEKDMDVFLLPSRYEGKPMAVTEAQMLGVVPYVLEYSSAKEQIESGLDGKVIPNNEDALYEELKTLFMKPDVVREMKNTIMNRDYTNSRDIELYYEVFNRM